LNRQPNARFVLSVFCYFLEGGEGMNVRGWAIRDYITFFVLTVLAVIVARWLGGAVPAVGKITKI
jgi:hypothetical protein